MQNFVTANYLSVSEWQAMNSHIDFGGATAPTLSGVISRASSQIDNILKYTLPIQTVTAEKAEAIVNSTGDLVLFPQKLNVQSVSSVRIKKGASSMNLTLNDGAGNALYDIVNDSVIFAYQQLQLTGQFSMNSFLQLRQNLFFTEITYDAGYVTIPDDIKQACNLLALDIWNRDISNPSGVKSLTQGALSMTFGEGESDLVKDAKLLLQKYVRVIPGGY